MALFSVVRYRGEDGEEEGVKKVMTLDELHSIAQQRVKDRSSTMKPDMTERLPKSKRHELDDEDLKGEEEDMKPMRRKKRKRDKLSDTSGTCHLIVKPQGEVKGDEVDPESGEAQPLSDDDTHVTRLQENEVTNDAEHPLPVLTHPTPLRTTQSQINYQLPDWANNYVKIESDVMANSQPLENFQLDPIIAGNLIKMKITSFFPVQCKVIPELMSGSQGPLLTTACGAAPSDLCICAPTGCGKTLSYVVPVVSTLSSRITRHLKALVIVPSKDLALQVYKVFLAVSKGTGVRVGVACSQSSLRVEQECIVSSYGSEVDVLVATPGRLVTHLQETPFFSLAHIRYLIIDEADRIFEQTYHNWLSNVLQAIKDTPCNFDTLSTSIPRLLPALWKPSLIKPLSLSLTPYSTHPTQCAQEVLRPLRPLQKLLFSATLSLNPEHLSLLQLHRPKLFTVAPVKNEQLGETVLPSTLKEYSIHCSSDHKPLALLHVILTFGHQCILCFTHSRESTHRLALVLQQYQAPVAEISGAASEGMKNEIIKKFKAGKIKALICSDGMARGMDIPGVECVVNYDTPSHFRSYLHRVGRTARAGSDGIAYTLMAFDEIHKCERMLKTASRQKKMETISITEDDLEPYMKKYSGALEAVAGLVNECK